MSNFDCGKCGRTQQDSERGYIAGCVHYPPPSMATVEVSFGGDDDWVQAIQRNGVWYRSLKSMSQGRAIHPVAWRIKPKIDEFAAVATMAAWKSQATGKRNCRSDQKS